MHKINEIRVRGAREHNLRDIDVCIPRNKLVVITGLSGSGKSSLAFDTLYAEGQRRYVESLSAYARQFLEQMAKPDVDSIEGLSPAISIEQKGVARNPRSTVGTITEILDHLRLLFARAGQPHCPRCQAPISRQSVDQMTDSVLALPEGSRALIFAPVVRGRKGEWRSELDGFRRQGFVRVRIDGAVRDLADDLQLDPRRRHDIDVVVDRLRVKPSVRGRVAESIETALSLADGLVSIGCDDDEQKSGPKGQQKEWLLSERNACVDCGVSFPKIEPRMFSFNNPHGACPQCSGLGVVPTFDPERIVPDPSLSLRQGAIEAWGRKPQAAYYAGLLRALARHLKIDLDTPWCELPDRAREVVLHGAPDEPITFELEGRDGAARVERVWDGVLGDLERRANSGDSAGLAPYRSPKPCGDCAGSRLRVEARHVRLGGRAIHEVATLSIAQLAGFIEGLQQGAVGQAVAERILNEIRARLRFLSDVGLDYLSLDRPSATLSGGEGQRIRLATQIGSNLVGVLYILDEPSVGLHPRDNRRLLDSLLRLRDLGNTVVVVEHDAATLAAADHIVELGPGAGIHGGRVVAEGCFDEIAAHPDSPTGAFLSGRRQIRIPARRRPCGGRAIVLSGCREHNLKNVTLTVPLAAFSVVTGVSGSGKSSLVNDTLHRVLAARLHGSQQRPGRFARIEGVEHLDKVVDVSQAAIGRTPRSNPATYSGAFDGIRELFSRTPDARMRGYSAARFSFNVKGGRCEACKGDGILRVEMHFLPDLFVTCEQCAGRRYNRETLEITHRGRNIADVLDMSVEEALDFLGNFGAVRRPLQTLHDVGLDYIHLGQPATTLSGGEAQRVKLAKELSRRSTGRTLYLLDEPTTGLHFADVDRLLQVLDRLVEKGNTVLVIEHHPDVIKCADYVVDLGPEAGEAGGEIVAEGTPEAVAENPRSHTGRALAEVLAR